MADYDRFNLRFTEEDDLRQRLEAAAKKSNRSLHQEIMARLRASFESPSIESRVARLEEEVFKRGKK
jgi:hypothetical protein